MVNDTDKYQCRELKVLRNELDNLKECQLKYFTFSITATGIIFGLIARLGDVSYSGLIYLLPLTVLLPAWLVFVDKAKTITRIVAYYRLLESILLNNLDFNLIGWENSLMRFRDWEIKNKNKNIKRIDLSQNINFPELHGFENKYDPSSTRFKVSNIFGINPLAGSYWFLINISFMGLIGVCVAIPFFKLFYDYPIINFIINFIYSIPIEPQNFYPSIDPKTFANFLLGMYLSILALIISICVSLITSVYNWTAYRSLTKGWNSYDTNMLIWCNLFNLDYQKIRCDMPDKIPLSELFTTHFMNNYTNFKNFEEMVKTSQIKDFEKKLLNNCFLNECGEDYQVLAKNEFWNACINEKTAFSNWNEMLKKAKMDYFRYE